MSEERPLTSPPVLGGFDALADRIEYVHTEHKATRSEQLNTNQSLDRRVSKLEFKDEENDKRLGLGAATFSRLEQQIEKVNAKIDWPWWKVLATVAPAILLIITWVWQAARYPDEDKFEALKLQVQELKLQNVRLEGSLFTTQATQAETNKKLDALLLRQPPTQP